MSKTFAEPATTSSLSSAAARSTISTATVPSWSVIVQSDLASSHVGQHLKHRGIKVKRAESVLKGSVIFPKAKVAFMVLEVTRQFLTQFAETENSPIASPSNDYTAALARVDKFTRIHGHCYILLQAPLFTERELAFLYHLQTRYLDVMSVDILISHSAEECVSAMLTISTVSKKN
ncbi:hypothetical protein ElyMa_000322400 [Elysia marginata]|uniref:Uncharacterized protein n=1 Tax=Elysia marginata TaxID=1093978 RepID=A0AAV4F9Z3_9GAST|nr:hypothetical protein ElyMa_000322400 [Elysia marginata]